MIDSFVKIVIASLGGGGLMYILNWKTNRRKNEADVTHADTGNVTDVLDAVNIRVSELMSKYMDLSSKYTDLAAKYGELMTQRANQEARIKSLEQQVEHLEAENATLKRNQIV